MSDNAMSKARTIAGLLNADGKVQFSSLTQTAIDGRTVPGQAATTDLQGDQAQQDGRISALETNKLNSDGSITSAQISDFATTVPPLAPIQSIAAGTNVSVTDTDGAITVSSTYTDTTYTAGDGLTLTGSAFSVDANLAGRLTKLGPDDASNYLNLHTDHNSMFFGGSEKFRFDDNGTFYAKQDIVAYTATFSDPRLKTNVERVENALDKVEQLNGYTFAYKHDGRLSAGVMADEVEAVLPSAVRETRLVFQADEGVYKTVKYGQLHALLIEAVKELSARVKELEDGR